MPEQNITASQLEITVNGSPVAVDRMNFLQEAVVDQSTSLPNMFILRFRDPDLAILDSKQFALAKQVIISAYTDGGTKIQIFKGEITAIEPQFREGKIFDLVVRGYDKLHRAHREVKSRAFLNKKDSDIASEIAAEHGLGRTIDATSTVYDHLFQHNQTNMAFLTERAWRIGYECFVDDGRLYFRKPKSSGSQVDLTWGADLVSFFPSMTLAEQVDEVTVKGWDIKKKDAIVGKANKGQLYATNGLSKDGASEASAFGSGKKIIVNLPVVSQAEANQLAQARLNEISGVNIEATGTAFRRPDIRAGNFVNLKELGSQYSGKYFVASARHIYTAGEGLLTEFEVRRLRTGMLSEAIQHQEPVERWPGTVVAIVTNTEDPENLGRVKVKFPWMSQDAESDWARVISPGAGPKAGLYMVPDVDDEVMVIFEQGEFGRPYVLGGVWNGKDEVPPPGKGAPTNKKPQVRTWYSRKGHFISAHDEPEQKIEIITAGGHKLVLDDKNKKIELVTTGGAKLTMDDNSKTIDLEGGGPLNVKSTGAMSIKSNANLTIEGQMIDIKASGPLNLKGAVVNIN